jgi:RNA polymerase sigma factor (TIGR02999 family)
MICFHAIDNLLGRGYASFPKRFPGAKPWGFPVPDDSATPVTQLLGRWRGGDREALDSLIPLVYNELRQIARHYLRNERAEHTLQSTALVHEAYVRLTNQELPDWQNRAHFFAVAAQLMRQILVDHARAYRAGKRGGGACNLALEDAEEKAQRVDVDVLALDDALKTLSVMDPQQSKVVELKFFGGLSIEDTAEVLGISSSTVKRDWITARAWLHRELDRTGGAA